MQTLRLSLSRVCSLGVMTILSRFCRGRGHQGVGVRGRGGWGGGGGGGNSGLRGKVLQCGVRSYSDLKRSMVVCACV